MTSIKRAVITGLGVVSPLGNDKASVVASLREQKSGISFQDSYVEMGLRSHVAGSIDLDIEARIDRKIRRFMADAAAFAYVSMADAIEDSGLEASDVSNERTGIVAGSGGASSLNLSLIHI